jgi:hypothetical protein
VLLIRIAAASSSLMGVGSKCGRIRSANKCQKCVFGRSKCDNELGSYVIVMTDGTYILLIRLRFRFGIIYECDGGEGIGDVDGARDSKKEDKAESF